jgi:hypothetical protein
VARIGPPWSYVTYGGGIHNESGGTLFVHDSVIAGNKNKPTLSSIGVGAGIANLGDATVVRTTITENQAHSMDDTSIAAYGGGIYNEGALLVDSSLLAKNLASGDFHASGGGIANVLLEGPAHVTINNSTIAGNRAWITGFDNQDSPEGGGLSSMNGGSVVISHSTISGNYSDGGMPGLGGGLFIDSNTQLHARNSIVANNLAVTAPEISGALASSGFNLFENPAGGSGYDDSDLLGVDPMLGPLADNGGPTLTMALLPGSPAIDAGDPDPLDPPAWDQRGPGFPRIVNGTIDIGAFEVQATGVPSSLDPHAIFVTAQLDED